MVVLACIHSSRKPSWIVDARIRPMACCGQELREQRRFPPVTCLNAETRHGTVNDGFEEEVQLARRRKKPLFHSSCSMCPYASRPAGLDVKRMKLAASPPNHESSLERRSGQHTHIRRFNPRHPIVAIRLFGLPSVFKHRRRNKIRPNSLAFYFNPHRAVPRKITRNEVRPRTCGKLFRVAFWFKVLQVKEAHSTYEADIGIRLSSIPCTPALLVRNIRFRRNPAAF